MWKERFIYNIQSCTERTHGKIEFHLGYWILHQNKQLKQQQKRTYSNSETLLNIYTYRENQLRLFYHFIGIFGEQWVLIVIMEEIKYKITTQFKTFCCYGILIPYFDLQYSRNRVSFSLVSAYAPQYYWLSHIHWLYVLTFHNI